MTINRLHHHPPSDNRAGNRRRDHPPHRTWCSAAVLVTQLMLVLDAAIVNIALPDIQRDLAMTSTSLSWVVNAYTLAFGGLLLLGARAGDILGRRVTFLAGWRSSSALHSPVASPTGPGAACWPRAALQGAGAALPRRPRWPS